ncbi:MAG: ABC transporter ATP-binding protein [Streptosporangiaceae bacterium]|nr:ABC transporter ATP-binding protein [Streptosporangiaceae bacterium]
MSAGPGNPANAPVLEIRGLCVDYGRGATATRAVIDADLTLHRGEVLGLAGESGSGKSTLAYGATRLLRQPGIITGGRVLFRPSAESPDFAIDILDASPQTLRGLRWRDVAIVFQSAMNSLNPVLSVQAQLTDTVAAHLPQSTKSERREHAAGLLKLVGISEDRLRSFPHELSGGMKQRVMIALALALDPQVVIMDEPTTALDVVTQRQIVEQVIRLREELGFSVLFITHDLSLLIEMADVIAIMYAGRIVESAPAQRLFRAPRHPYTAALLDSFPSLHGKPKMLAGIPGSPPDMRNLPPGCPFAPRCRYALPRCVEQYPAITSPAIASAARRLVACWLHEERELPAGLAVPEPDDETGTPVPVVPGSSGGAR